MKRPRSGYVGYVYVYVDAENVVVYVGQTVQRLKARDNQHFSSTQGEFDRAYTDRSMYTMQLICKQTFETEDARARWLDKFEIHLIEYHDTYLNGLNSTRGGQHGATVATLVATRRRMRIEFRDRYMPAFRAFFAHHGHLLVRRGVYADAAVWWDAALMPLAALGTLVSDIRTGNTAVPDECRDELFDELGFEMNHQIALFHNRYMPAFRAFFAHHKHLLVRHDGVYADYGVWWDAALMPLKKLGGLVSHIRTGNTAVPDVCRDALFDELGFEMDARVALFHNRYMPAFRAFFAHHKHLLVKQDGVYADAADWWDAALMPLPELGKLVNSIRTEHTAVPDECRDELFDELGFEMDPRVARFHNRYMPAFRAFFKHHKHLLVRFDGVYADHGVWWNAALMPLPELGTLVNNIRPGKTAIPAECRDELVDTMGFVFHTKDLKTHLLRASANLWAARVVERTLGLFAVLPTLWGEGRDAKLRALIPELAHWAKSASMWAAGAAAWHARRAAVIASTCGKRGPRFLAALAEKTSSPGLGP